MIFDFFEFRELSIAWLASYSLKDGLERVVRFGRVVNSAFRAQLDELESCYRFTHIVPIGIASETFRPEAIDCAIATLVAMCHLSVGHGFAPIRIAMKRTSPPCPEKFEAFFGCPVEFSAEFTAIEFRKEHLEAALPTANSELARACDRIIHEYLARLESGTTSQLIRNRLLNTLSKCEISEEVIAHSLHMSLRTLQRKLKEDGLTFKGLVDDLRHELAIQYIRDSRLAIGEIAYLLGFSGPSNFTRAFRRWTGMSPNFFRVAAKA